VACSSPWLPFCLCLCQELRRLNIPLFPKLEKRAGIPRHHKGSREMKMGGLEVSEDR
jgi:hypothetical protein